LSGSIFPPLRMRRVRGFLLVWVALVAWVAGWNVHAGMALAQAAGHAQLCATRDASAPGVPAHGNRTECACCTQALSATTSAGDDVAATRLLVFDGERASPPRRVVVVRARCPSDAKPRAPPAA